MNYHKYLKDSRALEHIKSLLLIIGIFIIAFTRTSNSDTEGVAILIRIAKLVCFILFTFVFYFKIAKKYNPYNFSSQTTSNKFYLYLIGVPFVFIVINFIFHIISLDLLNNVERSPKVGGAIIYELIFGSFLERVNFPLILGHNNYGMYVGGVMTLALSGIWSMKKISIKLFLVLIVFTCLISLILIDTRSSLVMSFIACIISITLFSLKKPGWTKAVFILGSVLPILFIVNSIFFANSAALESISRGEDDLVTGNSRLIIWLACFQELASFKPIHLIGYGEYGQVASGLSNNWDSAFSSVFENAKLVSTHNTFLQMIIDSGYIGLIVYIYVMWNLVGKINATYAITKDNRLSIFVSFILYFILAGGTEANYLNNLTFHLFWYIIIGIYCLTGLFSLSNRLSFVFKPSESYKFSDKTNGLAT